MRTGARPVLFIDDGGVLSDNERRGPQWRRLLGEFLSAELGGEAAAWGGANRTVMGRLWAPGEAEARWARCGGSFAAFYDDYLLAWMHGMCEEAGCAPPPAARTLELARVATDYVTQRVQAAIPGAPEAVHELKAGGFRLFTASGETSGELRNYLGAMGLAGCFEAFYGTDLIDTVKFESEYYPKLFTDAGVPPQAAVVIDDNESALANARRTGAATIRIGAAAVSDGSIADRPVSSLAEVPSLLREWFA